jgi:hypothetical protein
MQSPGGTTLR